MATLVLLKYNNYYNRTVKREFTLQEYRQYQMGTDLENINFIPNDYITTEQVINWPTVVNETPDYLLVLDQNGVIQSRWFIISDTRLTAGQLHLQLRRDLIVDYYYNIIDSPCFIEKATVNNINDPAIFNRENMSFNQIKQAEYPLKDNSGCAWIVGYIPRDSFPSGQELVSNYSYSGIVDETVDSIANYKYYKYSQLAPTGTQETFYSNPLDFKYLINTYGLNTRRNLPSLYYNFSITMDSSGNYIGLSNIVNKTGGSTNNPSYNGTRTYRHTGLLHGDSNTGLYIDDGQLIFANFTPEIVSQMNEVAPYYLIREHTEEETKELLAQNNKIIRSKEDGQLYRVSIVDEGIAYTTMAIFEGGLYELFNNNIVKSPFSGTMQNTTLEVEAKINFYKVSINLLVTEIKTNIANTTERYHLSDSPFDMFFIPFPEKGQQLSIYKNGQLYIENVDRLAGLTLATNLAAAVGKDNIYDLQLLPYCPFQSILKSDGSIDIGNILSSDILVQGKDDTGQLIGTPQKASVLFWATSSQFTLQIPFVINKAITIEDKKVKSETEFWRLCSPNYSGVFEFNPEKNGGVQYFDVDCNYKPFNPYIHVNPNFSGLYGQDWNDSRGLICGGDFSLPIVTDAWADYQLQNKNYQQMFDREIQNMEVNNSVQRQKEIMGTVTGVVGGSIGGAMAGLTKGGNPYAAIGGALMGGAGALIGGGINYSLNEKLRDETLDYKRDMFGYQLQNIQALPQGLAKVSAYTANNKIFPFLEKYGCTDTEKDALRAKLKYNGMTIMRIGAINEFLSGKANEKTYIKGQLIRIENVAEDFHILNAIADEIYKGVYI